MSPELYNNRDKKGGNGLRSIITDNLERCYYCGTTNNVELHHCIHGKIGRKLSTQYHLLVGLCPDCHRGVNGVHGKNGYEKDLKLKAEAQHKWEERRIKKGKSTRDSARQDWINVFGIDYINEFHNYINECQEDLLTQEQEEQILSDIYRDIKF